MRAELLPQASQGPESQSCNGPLAMVPLSPSPTLPACPLQKNVKSALRMDKAKLCEVGNDSGGGWREKIGRYLCYSLYSSDFAPLPIGGKGSPPVSSCVISSERAGASSASFRCPKPSMSLSRCGTCTRPTWGPDGIEFPAPTPDPLTQTLQGGAQGSACIQHPR